MALLLVLLGGLGGAALRLRTERSLRSRSRTPSHWGPFALNFGGCFLLGVLAGLTYRHDLAGGTALLGGTITAFSVCGHEAGRLLEHRRHGGALLNVLGGWFVGLTAAAMGVLVSVS